MNEELVNEESVNEELVNEESVNEELVNEESVKYRYRDYVLYMLLALIFSAPLFRGLFFDRELAVAHMYTAVIAVIYFLLNREQVRFSKSIIGYAGLGMVLAYATSFFVAWNSRDAIGEVLKVLNYLLVFWLVAKSTGNFKNRRKVIWSLYLSGLVVAFIGIGSAFGTFTYDGAFGEGLISSTLQYHNAGAIYMVAAGMLGLYLVMTADNLKDKMLLAAGNYLIFITAMGANSRGAMLVTPLAIVLQFAGLYKKDKVKYCLACLAVLIPVALTAKWVLAFSEHETAGLWAFLLLGMLIAVGTQYLSTKVNPEAISFRRNWLYVAALIIILMTGGLYLAKGAAILPAQISSRIEHISLKEYNTQERTFFYKDAIKMIKDRPVLGYGGGGWNAAYRSYQSYLYNSSEAHSHPLQVWIEAGILGIISYFVLWLGVIVSIVRIMRKRSEESCSEDLTLSWTAFAAVTALGLHSMIDFTLSLGALMIFLWTLFGIIKSTDEQLADIGTYYFEPSFNYKIRMIFGSLVMLVFFAAGASFWTADTLTQQAYSELEQGNVGDGIRKIELATTLDPFNGDMFLGKASVYFQLLSDSPSEYQKKMIENAALAAERKKGDPAAQIFLARSLITANDIEQALVTAEDAVSYSPLMPTVYEELANVYVEAARKCLEQGNVMMARNVVDRALAIPARMTALWNGLDEDEKRMFQGDPLNKMPRKLELELFAAKNLLR